MSAVKFPKQYGNDSATSQAILVVQCTTRVTLRQVLDLGYVHVPDDLKAIAFSDEWEDRIYCNTATPLEAAQKLGRDCLNTINALAQH